MLSRPDDCDIMIVEMGANSPGEIAELCEISDPDHGIITNIGKAHLEGFGSYEGVKETKLGLYRHVMSRGGLLFVNEDDEVLMNSSEGANRKLYGSSTANYTMDKEGCLQVHLNLDGRSVNISSQLFGSFNFYNVLAAVNIGLHFGITKGNIQKAVLDYRPVNNRSQVQDTGKNLVVMDAYNANPSSMKLAIESFQQFPGEKKLFILGDMLELGAEGPKEHQAIVDMLEDIGADEVILVGDFFCHSQSPYSCFNSTVELQSELEKRKLQGYSILLKGSRGIGLEKCLPALS